MNNPLISVIVPLYNVESIIHNLIDCFKRQTFESWELLLIDDGSTDGTCKVCQEYESVDTRIRLIQNSHQGVSATRNKGIVESKGEWITFVDADDLVLDGFLESLWNASHSSNYVDLVFGGFIIVECNNKQIKTFNSNVYLGNKEIHDFLASSSILFRCSPWAKLFRKKVIIENHIFFDINLSISEDRLFFYNYIIYARGLATTSYMGYIYGSFSATSLKNKHFPFEMLAYRQQQMTKCTYKVIQVFSLKDNEIYLLVEQLMKILLASMISAFYDNGYSERTLENQQLFFDNYFDKGLYACISNDLRWKRFLISNNYMGLMVAQDFKSMNRKLLFHNVRLGFSSRIRALLGKSYAPGYSLLHEIDIINQ